MTNSIRATGQIIGSVSKIQTINRVFRKCFAGMHCTLQYVFTCEVLTAIARNLVQSPEITDTFSYCVPKTPAKEAYEKDSTEATTRRCEQLHNMMNG
jgi:hypothetical protein